MHAPETERDVETAADGSRHIPLMRCLCRLLLHHLAGEPHDVRAGLQRVREGLAQARPTLSHLGFRAVVHWDSADMQLSTHLFN